MSLTSQVPYLPGFPLGFHLHIATCLQRAVLFPGFQVAVVTV